MAPSSRLDADGLFALAVRALARRPRSVAEVRRLLSARAASPGSVDAVLTRLREHRYLDDRRLAEGVVLYQKEVERHGRARVLRDLQRRGIGAAVAAAAVAGGYDGAPEEALLAAYIRKKRQLRPPDWPAAARLYRGWLRAGFSPAAAQAALRRWRVDPDWLQELEAAAEAAADAAADAEPDAGTS